METNHRMEGDTANKRHKPSMDKPSDQGPSAHQPLHVVKPLIEPEEEEEPKGPPAPRYMLRVEYIGGGFQGMQRQRNMRTVQGCLEEALRKFSGAEVTTTLSSRTDVGVHSLGNTLHVDLRRSSKNKPADTLEPYTPKTVQRALGHFLAKHKVHDMAVTEVKHVGANFHARWDAMGRTYYYRLHVSEDTPPSIFERQKVWHVDDTNHLDLDAMREATRYFLGFQDLSTFRLDEVSIAECPSWPPFTDTCRRVVDGMRPAGAPQSLVVTVKARSFLYHQVRLMVGTLKAIGMGLLKPSDMPRLLAAKSCTVLPAMAPSYGLYLASVHYREDSLKLDYGGHWTVRKQSIFQVETQLESQKLATSQAMDISESDGGVDAEG